MLGDKSKWSWGVVVDAASIASACSWLANPATNFVVPAGPSVQFVAGLYGNASEGHAAPPCRRTGVACAWCMTEGDPADDGSTCVADRKLKVTETKFGGGTKKDNLEIMFIS